MLEIEFEHVRVLMLLSVIFSCSFFMTKTEHFTLLSSGLLVAPKAKRRLSKGKGLRRRMPQRRRLIKQRRPAAQMETAQPRARHQRRVCLQCLW